MQTGTEPSSSQSKYLKREQAARALIDADPRDIRARAKLAEALFCQDRLEEAAPEFRLVAAADPMHGAAHRGLAAIAGHQGQHRLRRQIMRDYFERCPVELDSYGADNPTLERPPSVIEIRGFDRTQILLAERADGSVKTILRGGHFTTRYLLEDPPFRLHRFTIARRNIMKPGVLPAHSVLLNTIADVDLEGASLATLGEYLNANHAAPVINRPDRVMETARDRNAARFRDIDGLTFPRTERVRFDGASPEQVARTIGELGFAFPMLIRRTGTQTGRSFARIENTAALDAYVGNQLTGNFFLIVYREILWSGELFRKLRLFYIDGAYFPVVCHLDKVWEVHGANRKEIMRGNEALMAEERRFLGDWRSYVGASNVTCLETVAERVDLEFFGVDFTLDDEGRVFIYELNPAMRHSFDHGRNFLYKLPYDHAISNAFEAMVLNRLQGARAPGIATGATSG